jgi:hypothetical protein
MLWAALDGRVYGALKSLPRITVVFILGFFRHG